MVTEYALDGTTILAECSNGITIRYFYDENGAPVGMLYNGARYHYEKNLQGDIIGIYNYAGTKLVSYAYDAWGNILSTTYTSGYEYLANANPFRYRGYYFDRETGFYYLQSRYYDPVTGRYLSASCDISGGLVGNNQYAYCVGNPVMAKLNTSTSALAFPHHESSRSLSSASTVSNNKNNNSPTSSFHMFGYELRSSTGWENSPSFYTGFLGSIGFSSYTTHTQGQSGVLYAFAGSTSDAMNWLDKTYYAGIGLDLFGVIGIEAQVEALGLGAQISIGNYSLSANINLIGGTSITFGRDTVLGDGYTQTDAFTIEVNTGLIAFVVLSVYALVTTGNPNAIPIPGAT